MKLVAKEMWIEYVVGSINSFAPFQILAKNFSHAGTSAILFHLVVELVVSGVITI